MAWFSEEQLTEVGCEDIPGFQQISTGQHDVAAKMEAGLVAKATKVLEEHPQVDRSPDEKWREHDNPCSPKDAHMYI